MDSMEMETEDEEENIGHISRLPDDVLSAIFRRLVDAKCLMRCFFVSKRFACVVTRVKSARFSISNCNFYHQNSLALDPKLLVKQIISNPLNYLWRLIPKPAPASKLGLSLNDASKFLEKFKEIERVLIVIPAVDQDVPAVKWEAVFAKDFDYFLILIASRVRDTDPEEDEASDMETLQLIISFKSRLKLAAECFREALWRHHSTRHIIGGDENYSSVLQKVVFTDTNNEGKVYFNEGQIRDLVNVEPKNTFDLGDNLQPDQPRSRTVKLWHVPLLHLPICGRTMESATMLLISSIDNLDQEDVMKSAFVGDEVFSEAANEFYCNHRWECYAFTGNMVI